MYVDAQAIIYSVERHPRYASLLTPLWVAQHAQQVVVISSHLALLECLVLPLRTGDASLVADFEKALQPPGIDLIPIDDAILRAAANLRAQNPAMRTPDALHLATAQIAGAALVVTNDHRWRGMPGLAVEILDDVLVRP
ncbi:MAG TPA: PIN domain-containing protein [Pirellulaceae bacterium]|nr:PIN domain-containing protein [Pirellulaceae bacterium]